MLPQSLFRSEPHVPNAEYFSSRIDTSRRSFQWQSLRNVTWEAAQKDVREKEVDDESTLAYVKRIGANFGAFFDSDMVVDRGLLREFVDMTFTEKGAFSLVLGGASVGKSIVLQDATKRYNNTRQMVLYLDGRGFPQQLAKGLAFSLAKLKSTLYLQNRVTEDAWVRVYNSLDYSFYKRTGLTTEYLQKAMEDAGLDASTQKSALAIMDQVAELFAPADGTPPPKADSIVAEFIEFASSHDKYPVLIIDEANQVLGSSVTGVEDCNNSSSNNNNNTEIKTLLTELVKYTKQENKLSVLLATSEYSYPFRLDELMNVQHISHTIVAGELSPKDTWDLLVTAEYPTTGKEKGGEPIIGLGPHLAEIFLAAYGGHLLSMRNAVNTLALLRESFCIEQAFPRLLSSKIQACLHIPGARRLLAQMAEFGFAPLEDYNTEAAKQISKSLGGVVSKDALLIGLPESVWERTTTRYQHEYALIPSSQSVRLVIGKELLKKKHRGWRRILFWRL